MLEYRSCHDGVVLLPATVLLVLLVLVSGSRFLLTPLAGAAAATAILRALLCLAPIQYCLLPENGTAAQDGESQ